MYSGGRAKISTFRKPIKHGCGLAFRSLSNRSQNSSGSTLASTSSWISVRTFCSTGFGSRLDSSIRLVRNFLHFSLALSNDWRCWVVCPPVVVVTTTVWVAGWPGCWGCCGCWVVTTVWGCWVATTVGWPVATADAGVWAVAAEIVMCCWAASAGTGATEATGVDWVVTKLVGVVVMDCELTIIVPEPDEMGCRHSGQPKRKTICKLLNALFATSVTCVWQIY